MRVELRLLILPFNLQFGLVEAFPLAFTHVNTAVGQEDDAFVFKQVTLYVGASEGKAACEAAVLKHHAVARDDSGLGVGVQGIAHKPRGTRVSGQQRHLPIVGHLAAWNGLKCVKISDTMPPGNPLS